MLSSVHLLFLVILLVKLFLLSDCLLHLLELCMHFHAYKLNLYEEEILHQVEEESFGFPSTVESTELKKRKERRRACPEEWLMGRWRIT